MSFLDFSILDAIDILLTAFLFYQIYRLAKGTAAIRIFMGIAALFIIWQLVQALNMVLLSQILGSFIGCLALETFALEFTKKISDTHKFEGLTLYNKTETAIELLLCEDTDTEVLETVIYKLVL